MTVSIADRRPKLIAAANRLFGPKQRPTLRIEAPEGPGAQMLINCLSADWGVLGIKVERTGNGQVADLKLIDAVAPSTSPAWFLRQFRCGTVPICVAEADPLLDTARSVLDPIQRAALLQDASRMMDDAGLFIAIAAPVRWSLVGDRAPGYQDNRFARHPFADVMRRAPRGI